VVAHAGQARKDALRTWILNHDDSWLFIGLYVGLAVVLSIAISLFWLIVVVAAHAALEWYVHWREHPSPLHTAARVAWAIKLDISLILLALALTVYMEFVMGVAGLSAAARGVQASGRFIAWQRAVRGALLSLDDAAQLARAAAPGGRTRSGAPAQDHDTPSPGWGGWTDRWTLGDRCSLALGAASLLAVLVAPWVTGLSAAATLSAIGAELHPWP
jgi:hypothetical protein